MTMDTTNQMGLFDSPSHHDISKTVRTEGNGAKTKKVGAQRKSPSKEKLPATAKNSSISAAKQPPPSQRRSGLVPEGDVRLTANIKEDIHLKLKIVSAHRRTTIGELIEELVENHLESPYGIIKHFR